MKEMDKEKKEQPTDVGAARRSIWRQRRRRLATGMNVSFSILLALLVTVMLNYLSHRYNLHRDISWRRYYTLSDKTRAILSNLQTEVTVIAFFQKNHEMFAEIRNLLKEYEYAAAKTEPSRLKIDIIDPDRDLARTRELARKYDVHQPNVIVFEAEGRRKYVEPKDINEYQYGINDGRPVKKRVAFTGEQVFSSAIQSVVQSARPTVYFVTGHGERNIHDHNPNAGYSGLAQIVRRDNIEVKALLLTDPNGIPDDCSTLVIAGPDRRFSRVETDILARYLERNGRILLLLDPAVATGLEDLLLNWGVKLATDVAVGLTLTGRELVVTQYGDHPIIRNMKGITTMFYMPRSVEPLVSADTERGAHADRPRVFTLAATSAEGWAEANLNQNPPRFDSGVDRPGPISVAVAVEKGLISGIPEVELRPTRMVVIGDSYFVSNGALKGSVGGNPDFFMSALNWLLEREVLMAVSPKIPGEWHLDMNQDQMRRLFLVTVVAIPGIVALIGMVVWIRRRQ